MSSHESDIPEVPQKEKNYSRDKLAQHAHCDSPFCLWSQKVNSQTAILTREVITLNCKQSSGIKTSRDLISAEAKVPIHSSPLSHL